MVRMTVAVRVITVVIVFVVRMCMHNVDLFLMWIRVDKDKRASFGLPGQCGISAQHLRGAGKVCEMTMHPLHSPFGVSEMIMHPLHIPFGVSEMIIHPLHIPFRVSEMTIHPLHTLFGVSEMIIQPLHSPFGVSEMIIQPLHSVVAVCAQPYMPPAKLGTAKRIVGKPVFDAVALNAIDLRVSL